MARNAAKAQRVAVRADWASASMPTLPPEPPLFSTIHCWPVSSDILAQNRRDSVSVAPPAGNGLM
jgi:hypothetical protein